MPLTFSDWIALAALGLGIGNVVALWWRGRAATLNVAFESMQYMRALQGTLETEFRVVVTNHGSAKARNVHLSLFNEGGADITEQISGGTWPQQPLAVVQPGQRLHLMLSPAMSGIYPVRAEITWKDHRPREQRATFLLGLQRLA